jgi:hypothetical protein
VSIFESPDATHDALTSAGYLATRANSTVIPSGFLAVADFNGDGRPDIAEPDQTGADAAIILDQPSETVTAILNNVNPPGPGTQQVTANYPGGSIFSGSVSSAVALTPKVETPQISLIVLQSALALVLLVGAGMFIQSLNKLRNIDLKLNPTNRYRPLQPAGSRLLPISG